MILHGHYNPPLVFLSYAIAACASYGALSFAAANRSQPEHDDLQPWQGIVPAAMALGLGIWSMHFTGMAAFRITSVNIGFRVDLTVLSLLVALVFTGIGFAVLTLLHDPFEGPIIAGIPMAAGIVSMHFLGMAAMTADLHQSYRGELAIAAGAIAYAASAGALWLSCRQLGTVGRIAAALLMAAAI